MMPLNTDAVSQRLIKFTVWVLLAATFIAVTGAWLVEP